MPNTLKDSKSNVIVGLGSYTHVTASAGMYYVSAQSSENPPSSLSIALSQSGGPTVTSDAPSATQDHISVQTVFNCAQGDTITVAITSSAPIDNQLNTVKTIVSVGRRQ